MLSNESYDQKLITMNNFFKNNEASVIPYQICEICFQTKNLIICDVCKNLFHLKCLGLREIPIIFTCYDCKDFSVKRMGIHIGLIESPFKKRKDSIPKNINMNVSPPKDSNTPRIIKHRKKRINNIDDTIKLFKTDRKDLLSFDNSEVHYKRKKIKVGENFNVCMEEFYDKIENKMNVEEYDYERREMKKVWSPDDNPLDETELEEYIKMARMFWNYRNLNIENELCSDFFADLEEHLRDNRSRLLSKLSLIGHKVELLKKFLKRGITLSNHFDEIALKILHICKYKRKLALLFIYKNVNPYIEDIEGGFRSDVVFFQKEILSLLSDDEN